MSFGISAEPLRGRKPRWASQTPAPTQREIISPPRHRFMRRAIWRMLSFTFSVGLVVHVMQVNARPAREIVSRADTS